MWYRTTETRFRYQDPKPWSSFGIGIRVELFFNGNPGTPGSDRHTWHWIHRFLTKVYLEEMERHHFSSCQFPPLFLKTISQGELKKTNLWWISPGISMPCPLPSLTSNYTVHMYYTHAHCIVSLSWVFPKKNSLMLTDRLCTIAITTYNDIFRVNVEIAKIKQFDPQQFPFNSRFLNKTDSIPSILTLILFKPA